MQRMIYGDLPEFKWILEQIDMRKVFATVFGTARYPSSLTARQLDYLLPMGQGNTIHHQDNLCKQVQ